MQVGSKLVGRVGLLITCVGGRVVCRQPTQSDSYQRLY